MSGGARVVSSNEPFFVGDADDSHSLLLPEGSSATSATVFFAPGDWHVRLFARNVGSRTGSLRAQIVVPSMLGGVLSVLDGGTSASDRACSQVCPPCSTSARSPAKAWGARRRASSCCSATSAAPSARG